MIAMLFYNDPIVMINDVPNVANVRTASGDQEIRTAYAVLEDFNDGVSYREGDNVEESDDGDGDDNDGDDSNESECSYGQENDGDVMDIF